MVNPVTHQLWDFARIIGLRDRLRCPVCGSVGTYKPHGGWLDREDKRKVRRWLCKWCGFYDGPEGFQLATLGLGQWELTDALMRDTPRSRCRGANPWFG